MNNLPETSCFRNIFSLMHFPSIQNEEAPACQRDSLGKGHCRDRQDRAVTEELLVMSAPLRFSLHEQPKRK